MMDEEKVRVAILVPETGLVNMDWALQLPKLRGPDTKIISFRGGHPLDQSRNALILKALELKAEWLFFLDSDVIVPDGGLEKLISRGTPLISGLYKQKPFNGALWSCGLRDKEGFSFTSFSDWKDELITADVTGAGCLLIHHTVIERISKMFPKLPWFQWCNGRGYKEEGFPDPLMYKCGEDLYFCLLAQAAGFQLHIDTTVRCKHIGTCFIGEKGVSTSNE
jgi:hypothetical protein